MTSMNNMRGSSLIMRVIKKHFFCSFRVSFNAVTLRFSNVVMAIEKTMEDDLV